MTGDEGAVRAVIEADLASYLARDRDGWERNWVRDDRFQSIMECGTLQIARGWEAFRANVLDAMALAPAPVAAQVEREFQAIEVRGDLAWVVFEESVQDSGDPAVLPALSHNFRLLERQGGEWRILFHGCWAEPQRDRPGPVVEVDAEARVLWMNLAAARRLAVEPGLTISHGTLRASRPQLDRQLRNTVAQAHGLTGFGRFNRLERDPGGGVSFLVVLGEDADGGLLLCRVRIADGRVWVLFGDAADLSRQTALAALLFDWSEAQEAVLRLICDGHDLAAVAEARGVTLNTARTHLRRVFGKSGVSSQTDLLRLLISIGA